MTLAQVNKSLELSGTDKGDSAHTFADRSNLDIYEDFLSKWKSDEFDLIEIGVREGGSMRLWSRYFERARIHGIDIDPSCINCHEPRVSVTIGSQDDPGVLIVVADKCPDLRVVLDDGSHMLRHMMATHSMLWPRLESGGFYIFEDAAITRHGVDEGWPGMRFNQLPLVDIPRTVLDDFILSVIKDMDLKQGQVRSFHAYYNLLILEKV